MFIIYLFIYLFIIYLCSLLNIIITSKLSNLKMIFPFHCPEGTILMGTLKRRVVQVELLYRNVGKKLPIYAA